MWTCVEFENPHIKRHALHPHVQRARIDDVCQRYCTTVAKLERREEVYWDPGGMVWTGWGWHDFELGKRRLCVMEHLLEYFAHYLLNRGVKQISGKGYIRLGSWPHYLLYISEADRESLLKQLRGLSGVCAQAWQDWREHCSATK